MSLVPLGDVGLDKKLLLLDQIRCVDKIRLTGKIGEIDRALWHPVMLEMLA